MILCTASVISFIDRQIINLLVDPIRADLGISDTQISLLQGFAFALFYSAVAIPLGRLVDAKNRKTIIAFGMVLWSFATASCGIAKMFWQLFFARMLVGVGEETFHQPVSPCCPIIFRGKVSPVPLACLQGPALSARV